MAQVAMLRPELRPERLKPTTNEEWRELLNLVLQLLTRTYSQGDIVIIKVNDLCNSLGDALLSMDQRSRVLFLYSSMRSFILSVLKQQARRVWLRNRLRDTRKVAGTIPLLPAVETSGLDDSRAAAYLWLLNCALYHGLKNESHCDRVLALDGETLAEHPKDALGQVTTFMKMALSDEDLGRLVDHSSAKRYSKDMSRPYSAQARRQDIQAIEVQFGHEADRAVTWAQEMKPMVEFEAPW